MSLVGSLESLKEFTLNKNHISSAKHGTVQPQLVIVYNVFLISGKQSHRVHLTNTSFKQGFSESFPL